MRSTTGATFMDCTYTAKVSLEPAQPAIAQLQRGHKLFQNPHMNFIQNLSSCETPT
jgi:hypothetical protein